MTWRHCITRSQIDRNQNGEEESVWTVASLTLQSQVSRSFSSSLTIAIVSAVSENVGKHWPTYEE